MNDIDIEQKIAQMLRTSRDRAGISRDYMSNALGVSIKSIQNWEDGYTCPNIKALIKWFSICDLPLYPYMLRLNNEELMEINACSTDAEIKSAFIGAIEHMDIKQMRMHFFELLGESGTPPEGMGEVKTAYLHLPMSVKVGIAEIICTQFEICEAKGELVQRIK